MKKMLIIGLLLLNLVSVPVQILAEGTQAISYSVQAVIPETQKSEATYFDIEIEPGKEQELEVILSNTSAVPIEIITEAHPGVTNINGLITYNGSIAAKTSTDLVAFASVVQVIDEKVTVPANSEAIARIKVTAPEENFDGRILGGLYFSLAPQESSAQDGISIQNEFSYVMGLNMTEKGNTAEIEPKLDFVGMNLDEEITGSNLLATFTNLTPVMITKLKIEGQIFAKGDSDKVIARINKESFDVAPSYHFDLPFELEDGAPNSGEYILKATLQNDTYSWEFEEAFTIE